MDFLVSIYSIAFFLAAIIYIYLGIYIIRLNPKEKLGRIFFFMTLALAIWSVSYGISNLSLNIEVALFWRRIGSLGKMFMFSIMLDFMILLTHSKKELDKEWVIIPIYLPAIILTYVFVFSKNLSPLQYDLVRYDYIWLNQAVSTFWNYAYYVYFVLYTWASISVVSRWKKKIKSDEVAKQANLILAAVVMVLVLGIVYVVVPSVVFSKPLAEIAVLVILLPVWSMYHAARYHDLFHTKTFEAKDTFITDKEQQKIFLNIAFTIMAIGIISIVSEYILLFKTGKATLYEASEAGLYLLGIGIILWFLQRINKKSVRDNFSIIVLLVSIPIVSIVFLKHSAITVWVIPIIVIMSSFLFTNRTLLFLTTISGVISQGVLWVLQPEAYILVDRYDYIIRMIIIGATFFIGLYINRIYLAKIKENDYQIEFQKMVSDVSLRFLSLNQDNFNCEVDNLLKSIGNFFEVDRTYLFTINNLNETMTYANEWCNLEISEEVGTIEEIPLDVFTWWIQQLETKKLVYIEDVDIMPKAAKAEQDQLHRQSVKSLLSVPIIVDGKLEAFIGMDSVRLNKIWTQENINLLNIMSNILSSGIIKINADKKIESMAYYDNLTGLPNRTLFKDRVNQAIELSKRTENLLSIIFIDLDNFKLVNDTVGHKGGDTLLKKVSQSLSETVRKNDTVSRFGGDEFLILLNDVKDYEAINKIAQKIMNLFSKSFHVEGQDFLVTASAGIAIYPVDGDNFESLIKNADIAMYQAKEKGKNQFIFCTHGMKAKIESGTELSNDLQYTLERNELVVYYQPQINLSQKEITGVDALLRWMHPTKGMIAPGVFIPMAEKNNLINDIGDWVLKEACRQNKQWQDMGIPHINVAINMSSLQIINPGIVDRVEAIIKESGLDPKYVELEITESVVIKETKYVVDTLNRLKKIGVSIAIDDFGTEYSSLSRLKSLPIDRIKIDMQFIQGIESDEKNKVITMVIINLAKDLGMNVLAEGVETKTQLDYLNEKMCDNVQGYYYYKPMPAFELEQILLELFQSKGEETIFEFIDLKPALI